MILNAAVYSVLNYERQLLYYTVKLDHYLYVSSSKNVILVQI